MIADPWRTTRWMRCCWPAVIPTGSEMRPRGPRGVEDTGSTVATRSIVVEGEGPSKPLTMCAMDEESRKPEGRRSLRCPPRTADAGGVSTSAVTHAGTESGVSEESTSAALPATAATNVGAERRTRLTAGEVTRLFVATSYSDTQPLSGSKLAR